MEQKQLDINGYEWVLLKNRVLERGGVYKNADGSMYLHAGKPSAIRRETDFIQNLTDRKFPVPKILNKGEMGEIGYYIEQSIGDFSFGDKFHSEYVSHGNVGTETFEGFCDIACKFLETQLSPSNIMRNNSELRQGLHLDSVERENPDMADRILLCIGRIENELTRLPLVITHGDFSPRNIFPMGIIDFEHRFTGPVGYDVLTGVIIQRFWDFKGSDGKLQKEFDLNPEQITGYLGRMDGVAKKYGVNKLSGFLDQFVLLKAVWSLAYERQFANEASTNLKWNFRRACLKYCMDRYLNNEPIDSSNFKNL